MSLNSVKSKIVFTKREMNNEWSNNFLQNSPLGIQLLFKQVFNELKYI